MREETTVPYERMLRLEMERIVHALKTMGAERIILFGSLARGQENISSDVDLIVVMDSPLDFVSRHGHIYRQLCPAVDADILIYTPEEFARVRETPFLQHVLKEGILLYAKDA
jgi:predicted nucleotidyltransferase